MELISILEEKIKALISMVKSTKEEYDALQFKYDLLKSENSDLRTENDKLAEDNAQLIFQLSTIEKSVLKETGHVQELTEERCMTRSALDDLIKSIDSLVETENQL